MVAGRRGWEGIPDIHADHDTQIEEIIIDGTEITDRVAISLMGTLRTLQNSKLMDQKLVFNRAEELQKNSDLDLQQQGMAIEAFVLRSLGNF